MYAIRSYYDKGEDIYKLIDRIIDEVKAFSEGVAQSDDITLMIIKRDE